MRFSLTQQQRQEQRQIMTQRMIQSMEILQLTLLQLEQRIDQELEINPLLELVSDSSDSEVPAVDAAIRLDSDNGDGDSGQSAEHEPEIRFESAAENSHSTEEFSIADDFARNYSDTIDEAPARSQNWLEEQDALRADVFANVACPGDTLQVHLEKQLDWFDVSEPLREMARRIINNLNTFGYFPYDLEDFLGEDRTKEEMILAQEALALVKRLEPAGIGGKDLQECLLLQIDPASDNAKVLQTLITSCLEDISANRLPVIAKKINCSMEVVQRAIAELRHFNPRPGISFEGNKASVVIPDIIVEQMESGRYIVRLEVGRSPYLRISKYYKDMIEKHEIDKETKTFIRKKVGSAQWLIDAIEQRQETLLKVSQTIVDYQTDFFDKGQQALKPLKMQQIADMTGMHVTTVSRACDEKWVSSPQGNFPLRRLFSGGVSTSDGGEDIANDVVRLKLQAIVDKEDKKNPLSDDAIVKMLKAEGIQVARRTIVKYRERMDIPNSRCRRQWDE